MDSDISVRIARGGYMNPGMSIRVGHWHGQVRLDLGDSHAWFRTPEAVKAGLNLVRKAATVGKDEFLVIRVNGRDIHLMPEHAHRIGSALLRKADAADDWQLLTNH
jgi:hypothetical protein